MCYEKNLIVLFALLFSNLEGALVLYDRHLIRSTCDLYLVHDGKVEPQDGRWIIKFSSG
jgi:hypothetical protein